MESGGVLVGLSNSSLRSSRKLQASAFATRGIAALRSSVPEIKAKAEASMEAVQGVGGKYIREVKGMMSSELEQVLLKSTRPDDTAVKPKHVER